MAATRTRCWDEACKGVPFALNDATARLAEGYFGRIHYQCDTCRARWSVTPTEVEKGLPNNRRASNGRR